MTLTCPKCTGSVSIPDEIVRAGGFLVQCSECGAPIPIAADQQTEAASVQVSLGLAARVLSASGSALARAGPGTSSQRSMRSGNASAGIPVQAPGPATGGPTVMEMLGIDLEALEGPGTAPPPAIEPVQPEATARAPRAEKPAKRERSRRKRAQKTIAPSEAIPRTEDRDLAASAGQPPAVPAPLAMESTVRLEAAELSALESAAAALASAKGAGYATTLEAEMAPETAGPGIPLASSAPPDTADPLEGPGFSRRDSTPVGVAASAPQNATMRLEASDPRQLQSARDEPPPGVSLLEQWAIAGLTETETTSTGEPPPGGAVPGEGAPAPAGQALRQRFRIRLQDGGEMVRSSLDLIRLIKDGRLRPEDEIAAEGSLAWRRAEDLAELSRYFELRAGVEQEAAVPVRSAPACVNHRSAFSSWRCGSCGEYFCGECVKIERIGGTQTVPCPFCGQLCRPFAEETPSASLWQDLPRILRFPLVGWGPFYWVVCAILSWMTPFSGAFGGPFMAFFLLVYDVLVVRHAASGRRELPTWPGFSLWSAAASRALYALAIVLIAIAPLALSARLMLDPAFSPAHSENHADDSGLEGPVDGGADVGASSAAVALRTGHASDMTTAAAQPSALEKARSASLAVKALLFLGFLLAVSYLPMALLMVSVLDRRSAALNLLSVIRAIRRAPREYAGAVLLCVGMTLAGALLASPFYSMPVLGGAGVAMIGTYFLFLQLHVLGRMANQCKSRLGWSLPS